MSASAATLLGFDFGLRRIGVAVGQTVTRRARPLTTLNAQDGQPDWQHVRVLIQEWQPHELIVGLPVHLDGSEHERTRAARRFGNRLAGRFKLAVHFVDERLSSDEAERQLRQRGTRPGQHNKAEVDALAAQVILQSWLDGESSTIRAGTGE